MEKKYGDNRHEEHMFALHGTADTSKFSTRSGMDIAIERLLVQNGASLKDAEETAVAVFKGLARYKDNPPEKQADFVRMMIGPLLKDKDASFTDKPDPVKLDAATQKIMDMAQKIFAPKAPAPAAGDGARRPTTPPHGPKAPS